MTKAKMERHTKIIEIITKNVIETQEQLTEKLLAEGIYTTQATLSRDIRELKITKKVTAPGVICYTMPTQSKDYEAIDKFGSIFGHAVHTINTVGNLVILKTHAGMASAVASILDTIGSERVAGSLAGDDTIFVAAWDEEKAQALTRDYNTIIEHNKK